MSDAVMDDLSASQPSSRPTWSAEIIGGMERVVIGRGSFCLLLFVTCCGDAAYVKGLVQPLRPATGLARPFGLQQPGGTS